MGMDQQGHQVSTYIVAQSPEVLAHLLKDNKTRGVCPAVYTTPASAFNTLLAVQFEGRNVLLDQHQVHELEENQDGDQVRRLDRLLALSVILLSLMDQT